MHIRFTIIVLLLSVCSLSAQKKPYNKFWVSFSDKNGTPFSVLQPEKYLSPRALERRARYGIAINWTDLPVSPEYASKLRTTGAEVLYVSKWLNGAVIHAEPDTLKKVEALPFITKVRPIGYWTGKVGKEMPPAAIERTPNYEREANPYGKAWNQINMLKGESIHQLGFDGKDVMCAIFDGGFQHVNEMPAFDSLYKHHRILGTHDFVEGDDWVYESSTHGTNVLSCMASNMPGLTIGTGYGASFYLIKTEDVSSEMVVEEYNWLAAAELADSLGVDVVNSSLGYTQFDDTTMSYKYIDLNGDKAVITQAADFAAQKGMLMVNSAGNSGGDKWRYIGAPADADSILSVGAVDKAGSKAYFSSFGPTADGRIKPNVSAKGYGTTVASLSGYDVGTASGTSFSSPVMAGMSSALWDAFPEKSNMEVIKALEKSSNQSTKPDGGLGYGIPDISKAYGILAGEEGLAEGQNHRFVPGIVDESYDIFLTAKEDHEVTVDVVDVSGVVLKTGKVFLKKGTTNAYHVSLEGIPDGFYGVYIKEGFQTRRLFLYKKKEKSFVSPEVDKP